MRRQAKEEQGVGGRVVLGRWNNLCRSSRQEKSGRKKAESRSFRAL